MSVANHHRVKAVNYLSRAEDLAASLAGIAANDDDAILDRAEDSLAALETELDPLTNRARGALGLSTTDAVTFMVEEVDELRTVAKLMRRRLRALRKAAEELVLP